MNKFWIVLGHTYFSKLKSKAFIISTVIALLFIYGLANIQSIIEFIAGDEEKRVAVIDQTDRLYEPLRQSVQQVDGTIEMVKFEDTEEAGKTAVKEEEFDALLTLDFTEDGLPQATLYENDAAESLIEMTLEQQLQNIKVALATEKAGVDQETIKSIYDPVSFEKVALDETAKTDEELNQARWLIYIMLFVLYMAVAIYGQMIASDVASEKSSRVMEILISSAHPVVHMFAKIIGIGLLGLTQLIIFFIAGYSLIMTKSDVVTDLAAEMIGFNSFSISIYLYALLFFVLGYFLYATIAAMLGSLVSTVEDVQHLILPNVILIMVAFFIAIFGLTAPDAKFITITSFIPFFTPMIMFLRVGMLDVPFWEVSLSIVILIATIIFFAFLGSRIYRGGVLMYGPSRSWKDFKKAFQLTKQDR